MMGDAEPEPRRRVISMPDEPPRDPTRADPEAFRLAHVRRESGVRSLGVLCHLVGFFCLLGTLEFALLARGILAPPPELEAYASPGLIRLGSWSVSFAFLLLAIGQVALGYGLTHLQAWARWTVIVLTLISLASHSVMSLVACVAYPAWGLVSLAVGGAVHGVILRPLVARGAGVVFSREYGEVIRETPQIRGRMSLLLKVSIGLILAGFLGILLFVLAVYEGLIDL